MAGRGRRTFKKLWTKEELANSPSIRAGLEPAAEAKFRFNYVQLIRGVVNELKLPWLVMETACVFTHRYYAVRSFYKSDKFLIATACLFLASKVDNSPRSINDIVKVCLNWKCKASKRADVRNLLHDPNHFAELREHVLIAEAAVLTALNYDLNQEHPWKFVLRFARELWPGLDTTQPRFKKLLRLVNNLCNDSLITTLGLQYPPDQRGAAALQLCAKLCKEPLPLPEGVGFAERFGFKQEVLDDINEQTLELYDVKTPAPAAPAAAVSAGDSTPALPPPPRMVPPPPVAAPREAPSSDAVPLAAATVLRHAPSAEELEDGEVRICPAPALLPTAPLAKPPAAHKATSTLPAGTACQTSPATRHSAKIAKESCQAPEPADVKVAQDNLGGAPIDAATPDGGGDVRQPPSPAPSSSTGRKRLMSPEEYGSATHEAADATHVAVAPLSASRRRRSGEEGEAATAGLTAPPVASLASHSEAVLLAPGAAELRKHPGPADLVGGESADCAPTAPASPAHKRYFVSLCDGPASPGADAARVQKRVRFEVEAV